MSAPSSQPMHNTYSPGVTGTRPQVTSAQDIPGYNQTIPPPLPGISQYPVPSITARPPQGSDVVNTLVPRMEGIGIDKETSHFDVMYFIRPNLLNV